MTYSRLHWLVYAMFFLCAATTEGIASALLYLYVCSSLTPATVTGSKPTLLRGLLPHYTINPERTPEFSPCNFYGIPQPKIMWIREGQKYIATLILT